MERSKTESDRWLEGIDVLVSPWTSRKLNTFSFLLTSWVNQYLQIRNWWILHIPKTKSTKYLVIVIDIHLKWDIHATYLRRKLRSILRKLGNMKKRVLKSTCIYSTMHWFSQNSKVKTFGFIGWGGILYVNKRRLNTLQKYIWKVTYGKRVINFIWEWIKKIWFEVLDMYLYRKKRYEHEY